MQKTQDIFSILWLTVMVGWRQVGIQHRLITWHLFSRRLSIFVQSGFKRVAQALWGRAVKNRWASLGPSHLSH